MPPPSRAKTLIKLEPSARPTRLFTARSCPSQFLRQGVEDADRKQGETDDQKTGDSAAIERDAHGRGPGLRRGLGGADVGQHGDAHADVSGRERAKRADQKSNGRRDCLEKEEKNENHDGNHADGPDLALEVGLGAFLDGAGDLTHPFVAGGQPDDGLDQEKREKQAGDRADHRNRDTGVQNIKGEKGHSGSVEVGDFSKFYLARNG